MSVIADKIHEIITLRRTNDSDVTFIDDVDVIRQHVDEELQEHHALLFEKPWRIPQIKKIFADIDTDFVGENIQQRCLDSVISKYVLCTLHDMRTHFKRYGKTWTDRVVGIGNFIPWGDVQELLTTMSENKTLSDYTLQRKWGITQPVFDNILSELTMAHVELD